MQVTRDPKTIRFSLEQRDWQFDAHAFIDGIKRYVPQEQRVYNPDTKEWQIPVKYSDLFEDLRDEYLTDPNQQKLF
jgi:hypothetical protein